VIQFEDRVGAPDLVHFYWRVRDDHRIGATHISLYGALYYFFILGHFQNPVLIKRKTLMEFAKISGLATYHKCIKDLKQFGYIDYLPSYSPAKSSRVYFLKLDETACKLEKMNRV
jgi:hypothetical protein